MDFLAVLLKYYLFGVSACVLNSDYFFVLLDLLIWHRRLDDGWPILILEWDWSQHAESQWMLEKDLEGAALVVW